MNHKVLARKWRPNKFADLIGQTSSVTVLKNIINSGRLHHAYLLTGTRGVGKTTIARIIAKALNCLDLQQGEPCGICANCVEINSGHFVDVIEIDAASNTGVDNIREVIENAQYIPTNGKYKIYIIDEVHMLSKAAFNAMLKTLEEPPAHIVFILATTDPQKMPITILSRCLQLKLRNLMAPEISNYLAYVLNQEKITYETSALDVIATSADGSMRDALSILDQAIAYSNSHITHESVANMLGLANDQLILNIINAIISGNASELTSIAQTAYQEGNDLDNIMLAIANKLFEINLAQLVPNKTDEILSNYANKISVNDVQLYFEIANIGIEQLRKTTIKYSVFCMTLLRMLAFTIGTQQEIIIDTSNFIPRHSDSIEKQNNTANVITENKESNLADSATNVISNKTTNDITNNDKNNLNTIADNKASNISNNTINVIADEVTKTTSDNTINQAPSHQKNTDLTYLFNGNWFELIEQTKNQLAIYPILASAKLDSYDEKTFNITVNSDYEAVFNAKAIRECQIILAKLLNKDNFVLNVLFDNKVTDTLKEKIREEKQQNHRIAENAINNDAKLATILEKFSATIMSESINPI